MVDSQPKIIYEDDFLLVIDKPAGLVVNRAETVKPGESLQDWLEDNFQLVHRLDKETSGVMVVAKSKEVEEALKSQFKDRQVDKTYEALVYGRLIPREGEMSLPVGRSKANREKFAVRAGGRRAETKYQVKSYFKDETGNEYTLVELRPRTGRTHQLRVHLAYMGHPVVADERYGGRKRVERDRCWCVRQFLQARRLRLRHPISGLEMEFEAELPPELKLALSRLSRVS